MTKRVIGHSSLVTMSTIPQTSESIEFHCTGCGRALKVPGSAAGKRASCPQCNAVVQVPLASQATPPAARDGHRSPQPSPAAPPVNVAWATPPRPPPALSPTEPSAPEIRSQKSANPTSDLRPPTSDLAAPDSGSPASA